MGYNLLSGRLKLPAVEKDLMTYCTPEWISDYSYRKAMEYRERWDWTTTGPDPAGDREESLLVWGRVHERRLVLEPAFELPMMPRLPGGTGAYTLAGMDSAGNQLFSYRFDPTTVDHGNGSSFAFAIPSRLAQTDRLATIRLTGAEGLAELRSTAASAPVVTTAAGGTGIALSWESGHAMALVRDAASGEIISFARGGLAALRDRPVEVLLSDGVRSYRARTERRRQ